MSKKLKHIISLMVICGFVSFITFVVKQKVAAAKFPLSDEAQNYVQTCQDRFVALIRQSGGFRSHLRFMHYPSSLRVCSCVVYQIAASQPDDLDLSSMVFVAMSQSETDTPREIEVRVRAIGDEFGISDVKMAEQIYAICDGQKACEKTSYRWTAESH